VTGGVPRNVGVGKFEFVEPPLAESATTDDPVVEDGTGDGVVIGANGDRVCFENTDGGGRLDTRGVSAGGRMADGGAVTVVVVMVAVSSSMPLVMVVVLLVACANSSLSGETLICATNARFSSRIEANRTSKYIIIYRFIQENRNQIRSIHNF
jgi:hypothetical protein